MFQKVKLHKFIKRYLPIFLSVFVFVFSVPINVKADQIGVGYDWDGNISLSYPSPILYLDYSQTILQHYNEDTFYPHDIAAIYDSTDSIRIDINSNSIDKYLNGYLRKRVVVSCDPGYSFADVGKIGVSCDNTIFNDIFVTVEVVSVQPGQTTYDVYVRFNNYLVTDPVISLPISINHVVNILWQTSSSTYISALMPLSVRVVDDWAGDVTMYDRLDDVPSMDGYFAEQNTEIINQSTINNQLIEQQIQQDHEDTLQQTDTLTNGFDNSAGNAAADRLDDTTSDLNNAENSLFGNVSGANEDYTDITDFFTNLKVLESFSFIKSIMESIFSAMGDFAMPITIAFMFVIVTRIIGYQQFTSGGG